MKFLVLITALSCSVGHASDQEKPVRAADLNRPTSEGLSAMYYVVDKTLSVKDQYKIVLDDLEKDQMALIGLQNNVDRNIASEYSGKKIKELLDRINQISLEKTRLEKQMLVEDIALKPLVKFGVQADAYYLYAPERGNEGVPLASRNYDRRSNDFTLNLFEIYVEGQYGNLNFYADLDFGDFADQNQPQSTDAINHNIGQAYLSYKLSDSLLLSAGKMYTHVGYELAKAIDNWNYSRSFAFSKGGPFWHEGVSLSYAGESGVVAGLYVYDNWDSSSENNKEKTYGAKLGFDTDRFNVYFNVISGAEGGELNRRRSVYELNSQYTISDSVTVAVNGLIGVDEKSLTPATGSENVDKQWNAQVFYLNWAATDELSFTPRFEIFNDTTSGAATDQFIFSDMGATKANQIKSYTLTTGYKLNDFSQLRLEYRFDEADEKIWAHEDGLKRNQTTTSLSWLLKF